MVGNRVGHGSEAEPQLWIHTGVSPGAGHHRNYSHPLSQAWPASLRQRMSSSPIRVRLFTQSPLRECTTWQGCGGQIVCLECGADHPTDMVLAGRQRPKTQAEPKGPGVLPRLTL